MSRLLLIGQRQLREGVVLCLGSQRTHFFTYFIKQKMKRLQSKTYKTLLFY